MFRKYKKLFFYKLKKKINIDEDSNKKQSSLDYLFNYYGTDKANYWDKHKGHGFSDFYAKELDDKKNKNTVISPSNFSIFSLTWFSMFMQFSSVLNFTIRTLLVGR